MPPLTSTRDVLLILSASLDEAALIRRQVNVLNRSMFPPAAILRRRVAIYGNTRIGGENFFGYVNRAARDKLLRATNQRLARINPDAAPVSVAEAASYTQRVIATAVLESATVTSKSPWWDNENVAWILEDIRQVAHPLPLDPGSTGGVFRMAEAKSDIVAWLLEADALKTSDLSPYVPGRKNP